MKKRCMFEICREKILRILYKSLLLIKVPAIIALSRDTILLCSALRAKAWDPVAGWHGTAVVSTIAPEE
jgi:hypothetical protein